MCINDKTIYLRWPFYELTQNNCTWVSSGFILNLLCLYLRLPLVYQNLQCITGCAKENILSHFDIFGNI